MRRLAHALLGAALVVVAGVGLLAGEETAAIEAPVLTLETPVSGWTSKRIVTLAGTVTGEGVSHVRASVNGTDFVLPVKDGKFERAVVLSPGRNDFRVTARNEGGRASAEASLHARVEPKDVRVTMTWDTPGTDIDLWVTDPDGELCKYDHSETKLGGKLDLDVTTGFGPEVFTLARAKAGTYAVQTHYYGGGPPTRVRIEVVLDEGTPHEERREAETVLFRKDEKPRVISFVVSGGAR
jgi:uncharacterized protein YfaP (DUF2135 family)